MSFFFQCYVNIWSNCSAEYLVDHQLLKRKEQEEIRKVQVDHQLLKSKEHTGRSKKKVKAGQRGKSGIDVAPKIFNRIINVAPFNKSGKKVKNH